MSSGPEFQLELHSPSLAQPEFSVLRQCVAVMFHDWQLCHNEKQVTINKNQNEYLLDSFNDLTN